MFILLLFIKVNMHASNMIERLSKGILRLAKQSIPALCGDWKVKVGKKSSKPLKSQIKGTFILRRNGRFYKVIKTRHTGGNWWTFECKDIDSKQNVVFNFEMLGMLKTLDSAASVMKDPKDILLMDLDNQGRWSILTKDQIDKILRGH